ncbi:hypothetical protein [Kitasatospora sp. NPDC089509]|uniref:hypothetical protein n=1 Tax=Kitasatospora sp. NPDC089509 TaxID=3364079 RepID=UPI0037FBD1C6
MGYAYYIVTRSDGQEIEAGYGITATCEQDSCTKQIDRGLDQLCGSEPGTPSDGCGRYFCDGHLYLTVGPDPSDDDNDGPSPWNCLACSGQPAASR